MTYLGSGPVAISVIVINRDRRDLLDVCLNSVVTALESVPGGGEIVVLDNGSSDGSVELVRESYPNVQLVAFDTNTGFSPAVVHGCGIARGTWIALINNDAFLDPECLAQMLIAGESDPEVGAVTAQVRFALAPDIINTTGLEIDNLGVAYDRHAGRRSTASSLPVEVFGVSACVSLYRKKMLAEIGGFDPTFFAYAEDADVAWRARMAGWKSVYQPRAVAFHHGSATSGERSRSKYFLVGRNRMRLIAKNATTRQLLRWGWAMIAYDMAYVLFVLLSEGTLAPLQGRLSGVREWPALRRAEVTTRRPVRLCGAAGWGNAIRMRSAYRTAENPTVKTHSSRIKLR